MMQKPVCSGLMAEFTEKTGLRLQLSRCGIGRNGHEHRGRKPIGGVKIMRTLPRILIAAQCHYPSNETRSAIGEGSEHNL